MSYTWCPKPHLFHGMLYNTPSGLCVCVGVVVCAVPRIQKAKSKLIARWRGWRCRRRWRRRPRCQLCVRRRHTRHARLRVWRGKRALALHLIHLCGQWWRSYTCGWRCARKIECRRWDVLRRRARLLPGAQAGVAPRQPSCVPVPVPVPVRGRFAAGCSDGVSGPRPGGGRGIKSSGSGEGRGITSSFCA